MPVSDAMIVAGGRGTRLQPLTYTSPKPLLPFCGEPFVLGVVRRLAEAGVQRVHLIVGADTDPFESLRPHAKEIGVELAMVPEPEPLDTAGGVRSAIDGLDGPVLVLNGDILTDVDYAEVVARHEQAGADGTIVLTRVDDTSSYGVCVREGTRIVDFVEKPEPGSLPGQDTINAGTYVLEPEALSVFPTGEPLSFERRVFPGILEEGGHLEGYVLEGVWQDLGTPERWREGHRLALRGELRWPSVQEIDADLDGVRIADDVEIGEGATLTGPVLLLAGCHVEPGARVGPDVVVGRAGRVGRAANLRDCVLFDEVTIGAGVRADALIAGQGVTVAEGARLGDGVVLGDYEVVVPTADLADGERVPPRRDF